VKRTVRFAFLVMLLSALPLRGYAAALKSICESHHGGSQGVHQLVHGHGHDGSRSHDSHGDEPDRAPFASLCSLCGAYSVGAPLLSESAVTFTILAPQPALRIPFRERRAQGFVPDHIERPPLPL